MNLANKTFRNIHTGQDITVIDSLGDIAVLTTGNKVKVSSLMDSNQFVEKIDPSSFLSSHHGQLQNLAQQIISESDKSIYSDNSNKITITDSDSAIIMSSIDEEKEELARKYGFSSNQENDVKRQNEAFERILNPEIKEPSKSNSEFIKNTVKMEDPIHQIFKNTKRNVEFKIDLSIDEKIPRLDFIEMMEDSYEISIIEFLAKEFTNRIIENPEIIQNIISDKIRTIVFGKTEPISVLPKKPRIKKEKLELEKNETVNQKEVKQKSTKEISESRPTKTKTTKKEEKNND